MHPEIAHNALNHCAKNNLCIISKNFKIRRIIEYPEREEEGGGRERVECKVGSLGISL
jgi:hypothetical protein